jgi:hypothetical protein
MRTILKPSALKDDTEKILDKAIEHPQYVNRNGVLLVITKADSVTGLEDHSLVPPWEQRAKTLESFYDPAKAW